MEGCEIPVMPVQNHVITIIIRLITTLDITHLLPTLCKQGKNGKSLNTQIYLLETYHYYVTVIYCMIVTFLST